MSAPEVRQKLVRLLPQHEVTVGAGRTKPDGKLYRLLDWWCLDGSDPVSPTTALAELLCGIQPAAEAWWSPHTWEGNRRDSLKWLSASAFVVDVDYRDRDARHAPPPPETSGRLERAADEHDLPGNLFHHTPRGARLVFIPPGPVTERELYGRAIEWACVETRRALEALGLHARQDERGRFLEGYTVDEAATDLARFLYAPRAIVGGEARDASVRVIREEPCDVAELADAAPPESKQGPKRLVQRAPAKCSSTDFTEAAERWNADHAQDWGRPGVGECPACGHRDCFGRLPSIPEKWCCFSSNHEADSGGVGWQSSKGRWIGDALDLEACRTKRGRQEVLRGDGYLVDPSPRVRRPTIMLRSELSAVTDEAEAALLKDPNAGIFVRGRQLVRIARDAGEGRHILRREPDSPVIQPFPLDALREAIDRAADWVRFDERSKKERRTMPPEWVARTLAARSSWRFPYLEGVVESPTLKPCGELLDTPGYDSDSGLMLVPSGTYLAIPAHPTRQDALDALARLLEPFADFPFLDRATDLAAAIAAVLSLVARYAIEGCVPLFAVRSPAPGTGKGLLADVVCLIGAGRPAARMTLPREDAELRKVILTVAMEGAPAVLLDNVDGVLGSQSLASALTAAEWEDRLLGVSARVRAPLRAVWIATGNGLTFRGDLGRRVVPIDLDAQLEHPEDRGAFEHADLLAWTRQHRSQLLAHALTVLRAYHVAGRPKHGKPRKGSFGAWDDLVRGACVWVGLGDPCTGTDRVRREDDLDLAALGVALEAWREAFGNTPKTAAEAMCAAGDGTTLRGALLNLTGRDKLDTRSLGFALRKVRGRIARGVRFSSVGESRAGATRWVVADQA